MAKSTTVKLGEKSFTIGLLPVGVIRELDLANAKFADESEGKTRLEKETHFFDQCVEIVSIAIRSVDEKMTVEEVLKIPVESIGEIWDARSKILEHSGLIIVKRGEEAPSGEESAGAS